MSTRFTLLLALMMAFSIGGQGSALADDDRLTHEEAETAVSEVVEAVSRDYDCRIVVTSIQATPPSDRGAGHYFVSFTASGLRCDQAHTALTDRGKSKGLVFLKKARSRDKAEPIEEPILDLIHQIDPPVEN